jgi:hypothetical protein
LLDAPLGSLLPLHAYVTIRITLSPSRLGRAGHTAEAHKTAGSSTVRCALLLHFGDKFPAATPPLVPALLVFGIVTVTFNAATRHRHFVDG